MHITKEYIEAEFSYIYPKIYWKLRETYNKLYNNEEALYKKSDKYKKLKRKEYWNRPKEVIEEEALQKEMAKLDFWVPRQNTATKHSHITYANNAVDEIDNTVPLGFQPSITLPDFFKEEGNKIQMIVHHPIWIAFADSISNAQSNEEEFLETLSDFDYNEFSETFFSDYINVMNYFELQPKFSEYYCQRVDIVTNCCKVVAIRLEASKISEIIINIQEHPTHLHILGCKVNDIFYFPGIPCTYKIREIWK